MFMSSPRSWPLVVVAIVLGTFTTSCQRNPQRAPAGPPHVLPPASAAAPVAAPPTTSAPASGRVVVELTEEGFVPSQIPAQVGKPITLAITRKTDKTCAKEILFKGEPGKTDLPLNKEVEVTYTPKASGKIPFGCAMGMMIGGSLQVR